MTVEVTIAEAIDQLREQLEQAQAKGEGKALRFSPKSIEVELSIVFKSSAEGGGGLKAWFLDLSAKASNASESGHKVKLTLEPVRSDGSRTLVSDNQLEKDAKPKGTPLESG
jgi:hypothetical protein